MATTSIIESCVAFAVEFHSRLQHKAKFFDVVTITNEERRVCSLAVVNNVGKRAYNVLKTIYLEYSNWNPSCPLAVGKRAYPI